MPEKHNINSAIKAGGRRKVKIICLMG